VILRVQLLIAFLCAALVVYRAARCPKICFAFSSGVFIGPPTLSSRSDYPIATPS